MFQLCLRFPHTHQQPRKKGLGKRRDQELNRATVAGHSLIHSLQSCTNLGYKAERSFQEASQYRLCSGARSHHTELIFLTVKTVQNRGFTSLATCRLVTVVPVRTAPDLGAATAVSWGLACVAGADCTCVAGWVPVTCWFWTAAAATAAATCCCCCCCCWSCNLCLCIFRSSCKYIQYKRKIFSLYCQKEWSSANIKSHEIIFISEELLLLKAVNN